MLTIPKCYSALVASGNGDKCLNLKNRINSVLLQKDHTTGYLKVIIFKFGREKHPELFRKISNELKVAITESVSQVDDLYFGNDLKKEKKHDSKY